MPWKPPHHCREINCPNLVPTGVGHCAVHRRVKQQARKKRETWRDYDSQEWKQARSEVLRREPNCRVCGEPATVVDHIRPLRQGGTHDLANLRPLCKGCHDRHTYTQTLGKRRAKG